MRWEWNKRVPGFPWIAVGPKSSRLEGALLSYQRSFEDGRITVPAAGCWQLTVKTDD